MYSRVFNISAFLLFVGLLVGILYYRRKAKMPEKEIKARRRKEEMYIIEKLKSMKKKTQKDQKQGKATLISLLGYQNTIIYGEKIKSKIINKLKKYGSKSKNINETLNYILKRNK